MNIILSLLPILLFVGINIVSGLYFTAIGKENAFYQISPNLAIFPAIILAWILNKDDKKKKIRSFIDGVRQKDIINMCLIFLLSGAFGFVTKSIGSVDSAMNMALNFIPSKYLLVGIFITSAFISTSIGSSMGAIATLAPITLGLASNAGFNLDLGMATVIGGAMFGDNLSLISDTTIAAVLSQNADPRKKLKLNAILSFVAFIITTIILIYKSENQLSLESQDFSFILLIPYVLLLFLAICGVDVIISLVLALILACTIGIFFSDYSILSFNKDICQGFNSMHEIMTLSLLVGGLSGLSSKHFDKLADSIIKVIPQKVGKRVINLVLFKVAALFDILLANNTIAIIFLGKTAKNISEKYKIAPHEIATWLDISTCIMQGIIPYGAQILLASSVSNLSPLTLMSKVYYCYILAIVSVLFIIMKNDKILIKKII